MPNCHICCQEFADFEQLAHHIIQNKKSHKKSRVWAGRYLATHSLSAKARNGKLEGRAILTDEQKEAKRDIIRELSGELKYIETICPKCKIKDHRKLEIEYINDPNIWKSKNGVIVRLCESCG